MVCCSRIENIQQKVQPYEGLLLRDPKNRFYLTGFPSSNGWLLITKRKVILFVDGRYYALAKESLRKVEVVLMQKDYQSLYDVIKNISLQTLLYEEKECTALFLRKIKKATKIAVKPCKDIVEQLRLLKDKTELQYLKKSCHILDTIFENIKKRIQKGMTEKDIHILLRTISLEQGVLEFSFDPIIAINKNTSYPHYNKINARKKLEKGDAILIDFGISHQGYQSDMTRMFFIGQPSCKMQEMYKKVLDIQQKTIDSITIGKTIQSSLQGFEKRMKQEGLYKNIVHALGHGVGLDVHEQPFLNMKNTMEWQEEMVIAIEPGIYEEGEFGMRIEDMCYINTKGAVVLTKTSKELRDCIIK